MDSLPEKLKSCPFCGTPGEVEQIESACFGVGCTACDFQLMSGTVGIGWFQSAQAAVRAWNTRANGESQ